MVCHADSLVTRLSSKRQQHLERERADAKQSLHDALITRLCQRDDRRLARIVTLCVLVACWVGFYFVFGKV